MKRFISKLLFFFLPIVIIALPLDYVISHYLSKSNVSPGEYEVWTDIYNSNAECDIAIYGSSRAWVHIDPKILSDTLGDKVYNFGIDGHNFMLQYLRHLEFIKHNRKPSTIILSVDVFSLQKRSDLYLLEQFLPYMLWNSDIQHFTSSYIGYNTLDYYVPLIRYSGKSSSLKLAIESMTKGHSHSNTSYRHNGFLGIDKGWNDDLEKAMEGRKLYEVKTDSNSIALLENFMNECKQENIELILVYTPEYIEGQKFVKNRDEVFKIINDFSKKHNLMLYNYSNDSISFEKRYFYNASHLNKLGSEVFSRKLASDLKTRTQN